MRAPICGDNLVRIAFLDEAGRSRQEPIIVVAGVVIHGDRTYRRLVAKLDEIAAKFIPEPDRKEFVFHAKDIFHGAGHYFKNRGLWPRERRWPILAALAGVPQQFGIPIVFGHLNKAEYKRDAERQLAAHSAPKTRAEITDVAEHMVAFGRAAISIERQMHEFPRDEICMVIAENTDRVTRAVKSAQALLRDPDEIAGSRFAQVPNLPLVKVEDTPHFADKADSRPLQLADTCAFLIMRRLMRQENSQPFFEALAPQLSWVAADFGEPMGAERMGVGSRY